MGFLFACEIRATNAGGSLTALSGGIGLYSPRGRVELSQAAVAARRLLRALTSVPDLELHAPELPPPDLPADAQGRRPGRRRRRARARQGRPREGCARGRKGRKCRRPKTLPAREVAPGVFEIVARGLKPARYRFSATAVDAAGNAQAQAAVVTLTVRKTKAGA